MNNTVKIRLISLQDQIDSGCVEYDSIIDEIESVFRQYQNGRVMLPDKISQVLIK